MKIDLKKKSWQWAALISMAFVWGTSFILMEQGLKSFRYTQVAAFRIFFSFIVLIPVFIGRLKKLTRKNFIPLILSGLTGIFFPAFLFTKAQTEISSSLSGMLNSLTPFFTLLIGIFMFKMKTSVYQVIGIFVGLVGALALVVKGDFNDVVSGINYYAFYVVLATFCYGLNSNIIKAKLQGLTGVDITSLSFMFVGVPAGIYLLFSDFSTIPMNSFTLLNLFFIFLLAFFGSVLALFVFNSLISYTSPVFTASVTYIIPIFAIFWGILNHETFEWVHLVGIAIVLIGVWLSNTKKAC